jgi:hypothetical protein
LIELLFRQVLQVDQAVTRSLGYPDQLINFQLQGFSVPVLCVLNQETIKKVTIVVPVLMTSC